MIVGVHFYFFHSNERKKYDHGRSRSIKIIIITTIRVFNKIIVIIIHSSCIMHDGHVGLCAAAVWEEFAENVAWKRVLNVNSVGAWADCIDITL